MYLALFFGWGFAWSQVGVQITTKDLVCLAVIGYFCWYSPGVPAEIVRAGGALIWGFAKGLVPSWAS